MIDCRSCKLCRFVNQAVYLDGRDLNLQVTSQVCFAAVIIRGHSLHLVGVFGGFETYAPIEFNSSCGSLNSFIYILTFCDLIYLSALKNFFTLFLQVITYQNLAYIYVCVKLTLFWNYITSEYQVKHRLLEY